MKKFSFSRLLRNDRVMLIASALLAIFLWYQVLSGSANVTSRTITCTLTPTNVTNGSLQVIDTEPISVTVEVQGAWSVINELTSDDIRVQLNTADILSAGQCRVHVLAARNSQVTDYEIHATSPSMVTLYCDEWVEGRAFTGVTAEANNITAEGDTRDIGSVKVDAAQLPRGTLLVDGPLGVVNSIDRFVARVKDTGTITEKQTYTASIVALDAQGKEVSLSRCTLSRYADESDGAAVKPLTDAALPVLVTVNERREIRFACRIENMPAGLRAEDILSCEPASITIEGDQDLLEQYADSLAEITTVDFDTLTPSEKSRVVPLTLPEGLAVVGSAAPETSVTVSFNWSGYTSRTIEWTLGNDLATSPIHFTNVPADKEVKLLTHSLPVRICGKKAAVAAIKPEDLSVTVDMSSSSLGTYAIRPTVASDEVWIYYGNAGYTVYLSID